LPERRLVFALGLVGERDLVAHLARDFFEFARKSISISERAAVISASAQSNQASSATLST
jgi:hypothetical protein